MYAIETSLLFDLISLMCAPSTFAIGAWGWALRAGSISDDNAYKVITDIAGNVYVTGNFNSPTVTFGGTTLINADPSGSTGDIFLAKFDPFGGVIWAKSFGGTALDRAKLYDN